MNQKTNKDQPHYIGVDVCKDKLDVFCRRWSRPRVFANNLAGIRSLLKELSKTNQNIHVVCEATGGYEKQLLSLAFESDVAISRVNPRQVRDFARAKGQLAKTDEIDARILCEYGEVFAPAPTKALSPTQNELSAVIRRRHHLVSQLVGEKTALQKATDKFVRKDLKAAIAFLQRHIASCDQQIKALISSDEVMSQKQRRMAQIKGVGPGVCSLILGELPELGSISDKQAAALVGLAPMNRDSGKWRGTRTIHGGRALVRRGLYMPALCAAKHNTILSEIYQRLRAANKPHHVALTAVMRKMICLLNRILGDPQFVPSS